MLDMADTERIKAWLANAFTAGASGGKTPAGLAAHCGVSRQAVNGWAKTGRITKTNLSRATAYFGSGPDFAGGGALKISGSIGVYAQPRAAWPFPALDEDKVSRLHRDDLLRLEGGLIALAQQLQLDIRKRRAA